MLNTGALGTDALDPFPYIFLNLMLSMVAALQAPVDNFFDRTMVMADDTALRDNRATLDSLQCSPPDGLDDLLALDARSREEAERNLTRLR